MNKVFKKCKSLAIIFTILAFNINSYATIGANDGSAFITKAEFDALVNTFNEQMDTYEDNLVSKIDGAIANYLAGLSSEQTLNLVPYFIRNSGTSAEIVSRANDEYPFKKTEPGFNIAISYDTNYGTGGTIYAKTGKWNMASTGTKDGKRLLVNKLDNDEYRYAGYTENYGEDFDINWTYLKNSIDDGYVDANHYAYPFVFKGTQKTIFEASTTAWNNWQTFMAGSATVGASRQPTSVSVAVTVNNHKINREYDFVFSDNDNSSTATKPVYVYRFEDNQVKTFVAGKDDKSDTVWSLTNKENFEKQAFSNAEFIYIRYFGTTVEYKTNRRLLSESSSKYSGYSSNFELYIPTTAPVEVAEGCKWSEILYNDSSEYTYKYQSTGSAPEVDKTLSGYSMVAGLPLIEVSKDDEVTWNYEFKDALNGRKIYVKYGEFDGQTVEGDDITAFDASNKTGQIKFTAGRADMIFVKWGAGNTLMCSGSDSLVKIVKD